ncbi:glycosyltransferase [bacterium]|nr:glycosyltransferase [bacterium]
MKIAVLTLSRMGDILLAAPFLERLRRLYPKAELHLIVPKPFREVGQGMRVAGVHTIDTDSLIVATAKREPLIDLYKKLSDELGELLSIPFDKVFNLSYDLVSAILAHLIPGDVGGGLYLDNTGQRRIEGDWARMAMTSHLARGMNPFHLADLQLGFAGRHESRIQPARFIISDSGRLSLNALLPEDKLGSEDDPIVVMQTGASHPSKRWNPQAFGEAARLLHERTDAQIVFTGTTAEAEQVTEAMVGLGDWAFNLAGRTSIQSLAAVLESANLVISNDTGTMHLAQSVGTPVLCLTLGNALSQETGPYGEGHLVVEPAIDCFPCDFQVQCPHFNCHRQLDPALVAALAEDMLEERDPDPVTLNGQPVRIWRTGFDKHGFWDLELLHGKPTSEDAYRQRYRDLLKQRFDGLTGSGIKKTAALPIRDANRVSINRLLHLAEEGLAASCTLQELLVGEGQQDALMKAAGEVDRLQTEVLNSFLHVEAVHPLLALFRFEVENISDKDPLWQVKQTGETFDRLATSIRALLDDANSDERPAPKKTETPKTSDISDLPYDRFRRPRFRQERLTVLMFESGYYLQGEIRNALERLGHRVVPIRYLEHGKVIEQLLLSSLEADLLITVNHLGFDQDGELAALLEKIQLPYVSWFADRPQYILLDHNAAAGEMAHVYTWEKQTIAELKDYGFERVSYLPLATDETVFGSLASKRNGLNGPRWVANSMVEPVLEWERRANARSAHESLLNMAVEELLSERRDPLTVLNEAVLQYPVMTQDWTHGDRLRMATLVAFRATREDRKRIAEAAHTTGLEIVGDDGWRELMPTTTHHPSIDYGPALALYYNSSIQLNSTSFQMPTSVNQRIFDVPCAGGVLLTDAQEDVFDLFDAEQECFTFRTPEEARDKVKYIKRHEAEAYKRSKRAREHILRDHTYTQRLQTIVGEVRNAMQHSVPAERRMS